MSLEASASTTPKMGLAKLVRDLLPDAEIAPYLAIGDGLTVGITVTNAARGGTYSGGWTGQAQFAIRGSSAPEVERAVGSLQGMTSLYNEPLGTLQGTAWTLVEATLANSERDADDGGSWYGLVTMAIIWRTEAI